MPGIPVARWVAAPVTDHGLSTCRFYSGFPRADLDGNGALVWEDSTGRFIEAGPMVADLDRDGAEEIIVVTGIPVGSCTPNGAGLVIYEAMPPAGGSQNDPVRELDFPTKLDSEEPAIVDLNPPGGTNSKTIVFGSWSNPPAGRVTGYLYACWFDLERGLWRARWLTAHAASPQWASRTARATAPRPSPHGGPSEPARSMARSGR